MGRVVIRIRLTNQSDVQKAREGVLAADRVRSEEIEALVDTGATMMALPADACERLGLVEEGRRRVRMADGRVVDLPWLAVRVEILSRTTVCEALVLPAGATPLIGQIPLEALDLHVDPRKGDLRVNPASPDMPLLDLLAAGRFRSGPKSRRSVLR